MSVCVNLYLNTTENITIDCFSQGPAAYYYSV